MPAEMAHCDIDSSHGETSQVTYGTHTHTHSHPEHIIGSTNFTITVLRLRFFAMLNSCGVYEK